jgi:hypothetical protein
MLATVNLMLGGDKPEMTKGSYAHPRLAVSLSIPAPDQLRSVVIACRPRLDARVMVVV